MRYLITIFLIPFLLFAGERRSICLNMIVKNEEHVIETCLNSVKPLIDYWVIVDTGSTDETKARIQKALAGIPGELYDRPWVNFGHNRDEALKFAKGKGDYILLMDADEFIEIDPRFNRDALKEDCYMVDVSDYTNRYKRILLFNNHLPWAWRDVIHERLTVDPPVETVYCIDGVTCYTKYNGFRSQDPQKFYKDIEVLKRELAKDPSNARYTFYLAQTYFNAKEYNLALETYKRRAELLNGWPSERSWSLYMVGVVQEILEMPSDLLIQSYARAFENDPSRAEPLYRLAEQFLLAKCPIIAYSLTRVALTIPPPLDVMYSEHWMYEYGTLLLHARAAHELGRIAEVHALYRHLLEKNPPADIKAQLQEVLGCP